MNEQEIILKVIADKGWLLFRRGPAGCMRGVQEILKEGPVTKVEPWIIYDLYPRRLDWEDAAGAEEVIHAVELPTAAIRGQVVSFQGIEFREVGVRFLILERPHPVVPYNELLKVLKTLREVPFVRRAPG